MSSSVEKFARRLNRVEKDIKNGAVQPRLPYSSIDGGSLTLLDSYGNLNGILGDQWDGSNTVASVGGTPPPSPTMPLVTARQGGLAVYWDGSWADGSVTRMDFRRVTFHAVLDVDDFDALDPAQICGEVTIATGGEVFATLPPDEHFIFAVAWTDAGKFSFESDVAFGTPLSLVDEAEWQAHENSIIGLNTVQLPALQADLDSAAAAVQTLNIVTIPALQSDVDAAALSVETLNTVTLPDLQTTLDSAAAAVDSVTTVVDGWKMSGETTIDGGRVQADTIGAVQIAALSITADEIAANVITAAQIAADTITANEMAADSITANELAANSVTSAKVAADSIGAREIAALSITAAEIAANTITAAKIAALSITAAEIAANTITAGKIAVDAITSGTIAADAITSKHTITGATFQTNVTVARGIKIVGSVLTAYDGVGNPRFIANGSTGEITVVGKMLTGLTGNKRVEVGTGPSSDPLLGDISSINFFSGDVLETQAAQVVTGTTPGSLYITSGRRSDTPGGAQVPNINLFTPTGTGPTQVGGIDILAGGNFSLSSTNGSVSTSSVDYVESSVTVAKAGVRIRSAQLTASPDVLIQARGDTVIQYSSDADVANKAVLARFNKDAITLSKNLVSTAAGPAAVAIGPFAVNWTSATKMWRYGNVVTIYMENTTSVARGAGSGSAVVPAGSRPPVTFYFFAQNTSSGAPVPWYVGTDGGIYPAVGIAAGSGHIGSITYVVGT